MSDNIMMFRQFKVKAIKKNLSMLQKSDHGRKIQFVWPTIL